MAWLGHAIHVFTANSKERRGWPGQGAAGKSAIFSDVERWGHAVHRGSRLRPATAEVGLSSVAHPKQLSFRPTPVRSAWLARGFQDKLRDFVGVGNQREMACLYLDSPGAHPLCHEAL